MMIKVGASGVMQRLQCHGRKRSSQLFTRETETDGYISQDSPQDEDIDDNHIVLHS